MEVIPKKYEVPFRAIARIFSLGINGFSLECVVDLVSNVHQCIINEPEDAIKEYLVFTVVRVDYT